MYPIFLPSTHITLSSYLLWMSMTFTICVYFFYKRAFQNSLSGKLAAELSIWLMVGAFIGARLFHIILEYPEFYLNRPFEVFKFWNGGFVYYGGLLGGLLSSYLFVKFKHQIFTRWLDHAAPVMAFGYALGRIGCLLAGCCYGKACNLPWAVTFGPGIEAPAGIPLHPTQIYSFLIEMCVLGLLIYCERHRAKIALLKNNGALFYLWLILHGTGRIIVEQYRADYRGPELLNISPSTYISLAVIVSGFSLLVYSNTPKKL